MVKIKHIVVPLLLPVCLAFLSTTYAETFGEKKRGRGRTNTGMWSLTTLLKKARSHQWFFRHWLHRSKYTCRLCHVDIGFAMEAGGT
jgi:hypothetical protein